MSADLSGLDPVPPDDGQDASDQLKPGTEVLATEVEWGRIRGRTAPRIWTRPLRPLTRDTSYGFEFSDWCSERAYPLDLWEVWLAVHVGELLPDGRPRFSRVVIIVARQNGKTLFVKLLILWWAYKDSHFMILMTSTNLDYARAALFAMAEMTGTDPTQPMGVRRMDNITGVNLRSTNGSEKFVAPTYCDEDGEIIGGGGTVQIAAANSKGGRSLTINRVVVDEVREHRDWIAYNAVKLTQNAVPDSQAFFISNKGDSRAVVLNGLRATALGGRDRRIGLFEWSCEETARPDDLQALRYANPNLGYRIDPEDLLSEAYTAMEQGGEALAAYKTEVMCIDVPNLDPAIDLDAWRECGSERAADVDMGRLRNRVACCLDVAPDGSHAMLTAAAVDADGVVRLEVVREWTSTRMLRRTLPATVARVKPRVFGWFPNGPAAAVAADLAAPKKRRSTAWPPFGVEVREIRQEAPAVCMGFEEIVRSRALRHPMDELLTQHVTGAQRLYTANVWVFGRPDDGTPVNGAYSAAGSVHLARTLPQAPRGRGLITAG